MENNKDLEQSLKVIKRVADNPSWFGEYAHRWPQASLPLAYAMTCVEVVSKQSERASVIYNQIIEELAKSLFLVSFFLTLHLDHFLRGRSVNHG